MIYLCINEPTILYKCDLYENLKNLSNADNNDIIGIFNKILINVIPNKTPENSVVDK